MLLLARAACPPSRTVQAVAAVAGGRAWRAMRSPDGSAAAVPQPEEREEVVAVVGAKKVALERSVTRALPAALAASLASFDFDHDGTVDPRELEAAAALYQERGASLLSARRVLTLLALSLLGAVVVVVGMMFAVVELTRELSISSDGVLQVRPPPPSPCRMRRWPAQLALHLRRTARRAGRVLARGARGHESRCRVPGAQTAGCAQRVARLRERRSRQAAAAAGSWDPGRRASLGS